MTLETLLPIIINSLLIVLLIVVIILVIKCIYVIDATKRILDNVESKVNSLNGLFSIIDLVTNKVVSTADKISDTVESFIKKLFSKNKKTKEENELDDIIEREG